MTDSRHATRNGRSIPAEKESLEVLIHGIFAITLTLLVLELHAPAQDEGGLLWQHLQELAPQGAAYVFGFVYLMSVWISIRDLLRRLSGVTIQVTMLLLATIGLVSLAPFTVSTLAESVGNSHDLGVAVRFMAVVMAGGYLMSVIATRVALRQGLLPQLAFYETRWPLMIAMSIGPCTLGFLASYLSPWLGVGLLTSDVVLAVVTALTVFGRQGP